MNRRPPACKAGALPAELQPLQQNPARMSGARNTSDKVVGLERLELSTSRLSGVRSNHLSYRPLLGLFAFWRRYAALLPWSCTSLYIPCVKSLRSLPESKNPGAVSARANLAHLVGSAGQPDPTTYSQFSKSVSRSLKVSSEWEVFNP